MITTALDRRTAARRIRALSAQYGLAVDPEALIEDLPVGVQQRVEIIKTLYREAEILILDEPTAVLTPQETEELFEIMRGLVAQGKSIIFHHPQAQRGDDHCRPGHRPAQWAGDRRDDAGRKPRKRSWPR